MRHHHLSALTAFTLVLADQLYLGNFRNTEPTTYLPMIHALGIVACLVALLYMVRPWRSWAFTWGFWLLAGGNAGNLVNAWWPGYWVDYLETPWVAFNLVDVMIYGGFALVGVGVVGVVKKAGSDR